MNVLYYRTDNKRNSLYITLILILHVCTLVEIDVFAKEKEIINMRDLFLLMFTTNLYIERIDYAAASNKSYYKYCKLK